MAQPRGEELLRRVDEIEAAFFRVKESAEKALGGDEASKETSFQDVFALNNEIGRLGREVKVTMPKMKELQTYVNMITVGLKYDKRESLLDGLKSSEMAIKALRVELPPMLP
jgi:phosphopantetheinyl transferase (holo-ACP synthase)